MAPNWNRREFIKNTAVTSAAIVISGSVQAKPKNDIRLVKVSGPGVANDIDGAVAKLLAPLGGCNAFVKPGQTVMLKPNMGFATQPQIRATTSPAVVAAVAKQVLACKPKKVIIVDHPMRHPEACLKKNGIKAACKGMDVSVLLLSDKRFFVEVSVPKGKVLKKVQLLKEALEVDVHIALPLAKSHMAAGFSGGVKGHMGLILDRESFHSAYEMNQAIADLATVLPTQLSILDGLQVMTTGGPAGPGELTTTNSLIASPDIVAVDAMGVGLAKLYRRRIKPHQIKHLRAAAEMGVGRLEYPPAQVALVNI